MSNDSITINPLSIQLDDEYTKIMTALCDIRDKKLCLKINEMIKQCEGDYETLKRDVACNRTVNFFGHYKIYIKMIEFETDFICSTQAKKRDGIFRSQNGRRWIKIIGAGVKRINKSYDADYYGNYSVIEMMEKFKQIAIDHEFYPKNHLPEFVVVFIERPNDETCKTIIDMGIQIKTINDFPLSPVNDYLSNITTCNIDVTILVTICSQICYIADDEVPNIELFEKMKERCVRYDIATPQYAKYLKDEIWNEMMSYDKIIMCQTEWNIFIDIINKIGKTKEKARFEQIKQLITIVPDATTERINKEKFLSDRNKNLLGVGDVNDAYTLTCVGINLKIHKIFVPCKIFKPLGLTEYVEYEQ